MKSLERKMNIICDVCTAEELEAFLYTGVLMYNGEKLCKVIFDESEEIPRAYISFKNKEKTEITLGEVLELNSIIKDYISTLKGILDGVKKLTDALNC